MRKFFSYISSLLIILGMLGFIFSVFLIPLGVITIKNELPITDIQGIVEKNGKIYVGLGMYNRIQTYNSDGKFIEYVKTPNYTKAYDFIIDENGNPQIYVIYTRDKSIEKYIQDDGSQYSIKSKFPIIIEKKDSLGKHIKIKQPFHMAIWGGNFNCWLIAAFGVIIFLILNIKTIIDVQDLNLSKDESTKEILKRIFK